jgi:LysM repeat protein
LAAYNQINGSNLKSTDAVGIKAALAQSGGDAFASYTITPEDAAGPYVASIPEDYSQKAKLDRMGYTSVTEALAERFHMDENYLKSINKGLDFNRPGTIIKVANFGKLVSTPVARIIADMTRAASWSLHTPPPSVPPTRRRRPAPTRCRVSLSIPTTPTTRTSISSRARTTRS